MNDLAVPGHPLQLAGALVLANTSRRAQLLKALPRPTMAELRDHTSNNLRHLFSASSIQITLPASSIVLLQALIAHSSALSNRPHLKLTDVKLLESYLLEFASVWEYGTVVLDNKAGPALIANVVVDDAARKRKRTTRDDDIYRGEFKFPFKLWEDWFDCFVLAGRRTE